MTSKLNINWLNKCRCGNRMHIVETVRGSHVRLFEDDAVKCNSCGREGVIQTFDGIATVLWETDEERAEGAAMTSKLTRERLEKIKSWRETYGAGSNVMLPAEEAEELARMALAAMDSEPVAYSDFEEFWSAYTHPLAQDDELKGFAWDIWGVRGSISQPASAAPDYFASLVSAARVRADKAMRKFPQPNYVLNKVAEESGEVIKAVIHYTEGREEWSNVEAEIIDNLAMLLRLVKEGDQVIGFTPPAPCRAAMLQAGNSPIIPDGWKLVPVEPNGNMLAAAQNAYGETEGDIASTLRAAIAAAQQEGKS